MPENASLLTGLDQRMVNAGFSGHPPSFQSGIPRFSDSYVSRSPSMVQAFVTRQRVQLEQTDQMCSLVVVFML